MSKALLALILIAFTAIGVAHIFWPSWLVKHSGARKGGELLSDWNELGFQIVGAIFAAVSIYFLYSLFHES